MPFWQDWFDGHERMSLRGQCLQWWRWYHGTNFSARNCSVLSGISLYRVNGFCLSKAVTEFRVIFTGMYRRDATLYFFNLVFNHISEGKANQPCNCFFSYHRLRLSELTGAEAIASP